MNLNNGHIIGLRLSPERVDPDFYTLWFEREDGKNVVASIDERLQWVSSLRDMRSLRDSKYDLSDVLKQNPEPDSIASVPGLLYGLSHPDEGDREIVLLALNLLDDLVFTTRYPLPRHAQAMLDRIVTRIFEGEDLRTALAGIEPGESIEAVLASLGRVFAFSDFDIDVDR